MGYHLTFSITNHTNTYNADLNKTGEDKEKGDIEMYDAGECIPSGQTADPAFEAEASGNDVAQGSVSYKVPGVDATMIIKYGTKKPDYVGKSPGVYGFSVLVELQSTDGNDGFNSYFAVVNTPWGGSSESDSFKTSIDLYQAGTQDFNPIPEVTGAGTAVKLFNNTKYWLTLKSTENVQYGYDCVTGGTTCVSPGATLLIYTIAEGQEDVTLSYNLTEDFALYVTIKDRDQPYCGWGSKGAGPFHIDCEPKSDSASVYTLTLSQND